MRLACEAKPLHREDIPKAASRPLVCFSCRTLGVTRQPELKPSVDTQLTALESVDVVRIWHSRLTARELSLRRAAEVVAAARQAREYMRNADGAAHTVRPLLTYYGNASLARSLVLLRKRDGGEETLTKGHGLETVGWANQLSTKVPESLPQLLALSLRSTAGLFSELLAATENTNCIHVRSAKVDWRLPYPIPQPGLQLTLGDLITRLPDLVPEHSKYTPRWQMAAVSEVTFSAECGLRISAKGNPLNAVKADYIAEGYSLEGSGGTLQLACSASICEASPPQLTHTYVRKMFGSIPTLHLVPPLHGGARLSQIALTLALSYVLGMLTRYFPTHWMALQSGTTGDGLWPIILGAQGYVERAFPELVLEYIYDCLSPAQ